MDCEALEPLAGRVVCARVARGASGGEAEQGGGLALVDRDDPGERRGLGAERQVVDLATHQLARTGCARQRLDHPGAGARQRLECRRQQRIAGEHCVRLAELEVHARSSTALRGVVHRGQVVVHERIRVYQLDGQRNG